MKQEDFLYLRHFSKQRTHSQKPALESYSETFLLSKLKTGYDDLHKKENQ